VNFDTEAALIEAILYLEVDPVDLKALQRISGLSKKLFRHNIIGADLVVFKFGYPGRCANGNFIKSVMAVDHKGVLCAQQFEGLGKHFGEFRCKNAEDLAVGCRRIGQGAQHIENGSQTDFFSGIGRKSHGAMINGCKQKTDPDFGYGFFHNFRINIDLHPQGFEHIRAAALAGNGPVAMLGNGNAAPGDHKGGGC